MCASGVCLEEISSGFPSGYCTSACRDDTDCLGGGVCVRVDAESDLAICIAGCETAADCRDGYECSPAGMCLPNCTSDAQCTEVGSCHEASGGCYLPDGSACTDSAECGGYLCITEVPDGWPGGYCSGACETDDECDGGVCAPSGYCFVECATSDECRDGYWCDEGLCMPHCTSDAQCTTDGATCVVDAGYCSPAPGEGADGDPCTADTDCAGLICALDAWGWPGGYCSSVCDDENPCADGGICARDGTCNRACATTADCRDGYECTPSGCLPALTGGADGQPCTADNDCAGTICSTEDFGWPGGYCTGFCDDESPCTGGGFCASDGYCNSPCETSADCRDGYECTAEGCFPE
ncbi:hypothetical protein WME93_17605 [Sorangium sp. So ce1000]